MIKFILTVQLCSIVHMDCMKEFQSNIVFNSYYECMVSGHQRSINTFNNMGEQLVDRAKIVVKFSCQESTDS
jgi:hypothetical protein